MHIYHFLLVASIARNVAQNNGGIRLVSGIDAYRIETISDIEILVHRVCYSGRDISNIATLWTFTVHYELCKHAHIEHQCTQAPNQPTQIDKDIPRVHSFRFPRPTSPLFAQPIVKIRLTLKTHTFGLESKDAGNKSQVPQTRKQKEQSIEPLCGFPPVVEQQLRHPAAQVQHRARVPKYLAQRVEMQRRGILVRASRGWRSGSGSGHGVVICIVRAGPGRRQDVSCYACCDHDDYRCRVEERCFPDRGLRGCVVVLWDGNEVFVGRVVIVQWCGW